MNNICYCAAAFADDTVFVCETMEQLLLVISELWKWCIENKIEIKRKKSGVFIINDYDKDGNLIKGFPTVTQY